MVRGIYSRTRGMKTRDLYPPRGVDVFEIGTEELRIAVDIGCQGLIVDLDHDHPGLGDKTNAGHHRCCLTRYCQDSYADDTGDDPT